MTYEWGIESADQTGETADRTRCGHGHETIQQASNCLHVNTRRATGGNSGMHSIAGAIIAHADGTRLSDAEFDDLQLGHGVTARKSGPGLTPTGR